MTDDINTCLLARFEGTQPPDWLRRWLDAGLGGVLLFGPNITGPERLRALIEELRSRNPDVLIAVDEEGGVVTRMAAAGVSSYPGNSALGAIGDVDLTRQVGVSIGASLAGYGINLDLAPVADTDLNAASPVIGVRSFGSEPGLVAAHTAAFVAGLQENRVGACAKHFPGHGRAGVDSHVALPLVPVSLAQLRSTDLLPFRAAIAAGVRAVMTAHVLYPAIDDVPATISRRLLTGVLRQELGFDGVIITDALDMAAIGDGAASAEGAVRAMAAGADLLCLPAGQLAQQQARDTLAAAVRDRALSADAIAESAARVRALAAWARPVPAVTPDRQLGAAVARRGLLVEGAVGPLTAAPFVLDAGGRVSGQLDDTATSLLGLLRERLPATDGVRLTGGAGLAELEEQVLAATGRPVVVAVRDAHRQAWQRELIERVLASRPDAVVVGTGTVRDRNLAGARYLGTRGSGRANIEAAAYLLAGR
jgi:beta-N-acetylhexosaminidase